MYSVFRVKTDFNWNGWEYAPRIEDIIHKNPATFAGNLWVVEDRHPMVETMNFVDFVCYDISTGLYLDERLARELPYLETLTWPLEGYRPSKLPLYPIH